MINDTRIINILSGNEPIVEEDLAYLTWFIDEITQENVRLKNENKNAKSRLREIIRLNNKLKNGTEDILTNIQIEINQILDWIESEHGN